MPIRPPADSAPPVSSTPPPPEDQSCGPVKKFHPTAPTRDTVTHAIATDPPTSATRNATCLNERSPFGHETICNAHDTEQRRDQNTELTERTECVHAAYKWYPLA